MLLVEYWSDKGHMVELPDEQGDKRRKWKSALMVRDSSGFITEYSLRPEGKVRLSEMLTYLKDSIGKHADADTVACGFKVW